VFYPPQVGSQDSSSIISASSGNNPIGDGLQWSVGSRNLDISAALGRILDLSKSRDGRAAVVEFMSSMEPQVQPLLHGCPPECFTSLQASQQLMADVSSLCGELTTLERHILSNIPTSTVVDELCELA